MTTEQVTAPAPWHQALAEEAPAPARPGTPPRPPQTRRGVREGGTSCTDTLSSR
ncbi:hypothetical protein ACWKT5_22340 [Streptomyces avermitilis]